MFIELYILISIMMVFLFTSAFYSKQEMLWVVTIVLAGILMVSGYNIEYHSSYAVKPFLVQSYSVPYLVNISFLFMALSIVLMLFDIYEKYGTALIWRWKENKNKKEKIPKDI